MASTVLPPTSQHEAKDDTPARESGSAPAPVLSEGAVSASSPPAISPTASSELGLPGTFPRDPHVPLDRLSEKAQIATEETDSGTLLGAAREDVRRAVDAAAQYLPEGVVGAIGSVLAVGTLDSAEKLDTAQTSESSPSGRTRTTFSGFDPSKLGVAGIATDLNLPSKSLEAPASTTAARRASEPSSTAVKPAFVSYLPGPVITGSTPPPDGKDIPSKTHQREDYPAFVTYTPGPVITDTPPSDDDDATQKETQISSERDQPDVEPDSAKDPSKKKGAAEAAALGAGLGTLGGAAYKRSTPAGQSEGLAKQPSSQETAKASGDVGALPKSSDVPAPAVASKEPIQEGAKAQRSADTDASNDATKKREVLQAAALGAGIGTVGGAAYEYSRPSAHAPEKITSDETSGLGANVKAHPDAPVPTSTSKELQDQTHIAPPTTQGTRPTTQNETLTAGAAAAAVPAQKEAMREPSAFADDKQPAAPTEKDKDKDAPPVLAPVTSSDRKSDKEAKKEAKRLEEEKKKAEKKAEKERQDKEKEVAAAAAAAEAAKKRAQKEAKEREKEMKKEAKTKEKEEKKLQKEAEKETKEREKEMKRQEKEVAAAAVGGGVGAEKVKDAKQDGDQPEEKVEKKEGDEESKGISGTRTRDEAAAAAAATLAAASAEREHKRKASVDSPPESKGTQADSKQATNDLPSQKRPGAIEDKTAGTGEAVGNKQLKESSKDESRNLRKDETNADKSKTKTKEGVAAATAAAGVTGATTAVAVDSAKQEKEQKPSVDVSQPSKDATCAPEGGSKPTRPGPTALTNDQAPAKSGADSDFPLPSEGAPTTAVRAVDISGKGPSATPPLVTGPEKGTGIAKTTSAPAAVSEQTAPPPEHDRKRYHGTEGLQEKYEGGALKSSFIKRRSDEVDREEESPGGASDKSGKDDKDSAKERSQWEKEQTKDEKSSGSGKKEGIVKHIVEKVKDKLHHH